MSREMTRITASVFFMSFFFSSLFSGAACPEMFSFCDCRRWDTKKKSFRPAAKGPDDTFLRKHAKLILPRQGGKIRLHPELRYDQALVVWKFLSRTSRRQVSWLAALTQSRLPGLPVTAFPHGFALPHTVTGSHRPCTCFPFTLCRPQRRRGTVCYFFSFPLQCGSHC